jgi:hypothetical protein
VFETNDALKNKLKMRKFLQDGEQHEELMVRVFYVSFTILFCITELKVVSLNSGPVRRVRRKGKIPAFLNIQRFIVDR